MNQSFEVENAPPAGIPYFLFLLAVAYFISLLF